MSYIGVVQWSALERWSVAPEQAARLSDHPSVPLRDLLQERRERVVLKGGFGDASPITIHLNGTISVRKVTKVYKGVTFLAQTGDLVFSKIDARNGAIGIVPPAISTAVVTPEFPIFTVRTDRIDSDYLKFVLRTGGFHQRLRALATGTSGRKRITPEAFLAMKVPVPEELDQQRAIIAEHQAVVAKAEALEREAVAKDAAGEAEFEAALGLGRPASAEHRPVFMTNFGALDRWSPEAVATGVATAGFGSNYGTIPSLPLRAVAHIAYGLQKSGDNRPGAHARPYLSVANVQRERLDLRVVKRIEVPEASMPRYRLEDGDVLLCEGNSADLVGRCAIWRNEIPDCVHQNHIIRVRADRSKALPEFLMAVINSGHGRAYFRACAKRTTNLASISATEVAGLPVPDIEPDRQKELVERLDAARAAADVLRKEADALRRRAAEDAEKAIFADAN